MAVGAAYIIVSAIIAMAQQAAQIEQQKNAIEANNELENQNHAFKMGQLSDQQEQINDQASLEKLERHRQALKTLGKNTVSAATAGVTGNSILKQIVDTQIQEGYDLGIIETNRENAVEQSQAKMTNSFNTAKYTSEQDINPMMAFFSVGMKGMDAGTQAYGQSMKWEDSSGYKPHRTDGKH